MFISSFIGRRWGPRVLLLGGLGLSLVFNAAFGFLVTRYGMIKSGYIILFALTAIALFALSRLKESFSKDLDYVEIE